MFVKVTVQGDAVALVEQVLQGVDPLDAQGALDAVLQVRVIEDHVEAEGLGSDRDRLRSATCAEGKGQGELTEPSFPVSTRLSPHQNLRTVPWGLLGSPDISLPCLSFLISTHSYERLALIS